MLARLLRVSPASSSFPRRLTPLFTGSVLAALLALAGCGGSDDEPVASGTTAAKEPLLIGAASDLRPAFTELAKRYEQQTGTKVTLTFGASGQLAQQLENGAPFALFASASIDYVDAVLKAGRGDRSTRAIYAYGRLALWSPDRRVTLADLNDPALKTIAVADPDHAPYGKAAVQALRSAGLYAEVKNKLVYGDNVAATQQLAASGNADVAIIARALALHSGGHMTPVPERLHEPIAQGLLVTGTGAAAQQARTFVALLKSPDGQALLAKDGFILPASEQATTPRPAN